MGATEILEFLAADGESVFAFGDVFGAVNAKIPFVPASSFEAFSEGIFGVSVVFFHNDSFISSRSHFCTGLLACWNGTKDWGTGIRTPTNRFRVWCPTVRRYPIVLTPGFHRSDWDYSIPVGFSQGARPANFEFV